MTNHPNRGAGHPARNPAPAEVRAAREAAGLTQTQAAALVHASARNWQQWEQEAGSNVRRMHPGLWELFRLKAQDCRLIQTRTQAGVCSSTGPARKGTPRSAKGD